MKTLISILALAGASAATHAQDIALPQALGLAVKESLKETEERKQQDIITYAKNNNPADNSGGQNFSDADFYSLYLNDADNRYYNNYRNNNTDPIITSMPAPGANLDYYMVNPCSSGNYDKTINN